MKKNILFVLSCVLACSLIVVGAETNLQSTKVIEGLKGQIGRAGTFKTLSLENDQSPSDGQVLKWNTGNTVTWEDDAGAAGGDSITVDGVAVVDPDFDDGGDVNFTDTVNVITATIKADSVALGTDTTGNYAAGDAEAGAALTGDSATAFFSAGTIEHEYGGLEADVSAYGGIVGITGGSTLDVNTEAELETALGGIDVIVSTEINTFAELDAIVADEDLVGTTTTFAGGDITGNIKTAVIVDDSHNHVIANIDSMTSAALAGQISDETGSGLAVFATSPTLTTPNIGVATATTVNKVTLTAPATSATITATDGTTTTLSGGTHSGTNTGDNTVATSGDSATAFFSSGTIEHEYGGLEADVNAYSGLVAISGGATSEVDAKSELETQIADVADFAEADGDTYTGTHDFGGADDLEIPNGAAPTVDTIGQIAIDSTDDQLVYYGASKRVITYDNSKSFVLESPVDADRFIFWQVNDNITITSINGIVDPADSAESVVIALYESSSTGDFTDLATNGIDGATTITADNDGADDDGSLSNASVDAGDWIGIDIGTVTGTVTWLTVTFEFTYDAQ